MKVGFIGLGHMGSPMASNVLKAGFALAVHDLDRRAADNLLVRGAEWADSPRAVAQASDVVITSLPGPPQVEAVLLGRDGVLAGIQSGAVWIDMSTNSPAVLKRIAAEAAQKGVQTLDAPVTGAVDGAHAGTLTIFVGGERAVFEKCLPVFQAMGTNVLHMGPQGAGSAVKLLTNMLWFINAAAIGEALMLGARSGVDLQALWGAIKQSAGNSWVVEHDMPAIFSGSYDPSFTLNLCCKDLRLITELGRDTGVPLEMGAQAEQVFIRARTQYGGEQGEMHVVKLLEDTTGTSLRANLSPFGRPISNNQLPLTSPSL